MKTSSRTPILSPLLFCFICLLSLDARGETKLCVKQKVTAKNGTFDLSSAITLSDTGKCAKGFKEIKGALNDGSHIYGNARNGSKIISSDTTLPVGSHEYKDFTVNEGVTLTVPSGTVIRTTGFFTNNGTIAVSTYVKGGTSLAADPNLLTRRSKPAMSGIAPATSGFGSFGGSLNVVASPFGPSGASSAGLVLLPGPMGGGGGGPGDGITGGFGGTGGDGGGTLVIICKGSIINTGTINAAGKDGTFGGGGGGGGILVLAARTSVVSTGPILVNGGNGGLPTSSAGSGGGGGGGGVNIISPSIAHNDTINFAGGAGVLESQAGLITSTPRSSGGNGGASFGAAGQAGSVRANGSSFGSNSGLAGSVNLITVKPEGLF